MPKELPSAVCEEAFPADPDFPQLKVATDPALMLEVFRAHLKPVSEKAYDIQECTPVRFRCRPSSSRCVLQYALRLVERSSGRHCDPWITAVRYAEPGRTEEHWRELKSADSWRRIPIPSVTPRTCWRTSFAASACQRGLSKSPAPPAGRLSKSTSPECRGAGASGWTCSTPPPWWKPPPASSNARNRSGPKR
jgi:hypothetical protein